VEDALRTAGRWLAARPAVQLGIGAVVLALGFPSGLTGSVALALLCAAIGIGVMEAWPMLPRWLREPSAGIADVLAVTFVLGVGVAVFADVLTHSPDWQMGDWGPQRAVLARIMPSLPGLDVPVWNHVVSTGDAPLELYPALTYLVTGHVALALGLEGDLPLALMIVAVTVHLGLAAGTTLVASRLGPRPVAIALGLLALTDSGAIAHGGTVGLLHWALLHSAFGHLCSLIATLGVLGALRRPRPAMAVVIWLGTAVAVAAHPAALITAAASVVALLAVALLAGDVPPRRAVIVAGHVVLGVALGAIVWMPMSARILLYGQHFSNTLRSPARLLEDLLALPAPVSAYALVAAFGYLGVGAGLWSRRAQVVFVAAIVLLLLLGLTDAPYLALELAPGKGVARLGSERLAQLARPFVFAAAGYAASLVLASIRAAWAGAPRRSRIAAAAVLGVLGGLAVRTTPIAFRSMVARAENEAKIFAPDARGRHELTAWARREVAAMGPQRWGRALFEQDTHEQLHLTAETGLPTLHLSAIPDMLLRERIDDTSEASLRRFDVRWVVALDRSPSLGDPATEQVFGKYHVREIAGWDGAFARIERGHGAVRTVRLDDRAVEIEVTGDEPVLVALGTGFYPRWRATHARGFDEPVYAMKATPIAESTVVAAWVAPGTTVFTVDGPLPSDHDGRAISYLAALVAVAGLIVWGRTRWRIRALRRLARWRARAGGVAIAVGRVVVPLVLLGLGLRGCAAGRRPIGALEVGHGARGAATIEARVGDGWRTCDYLRITGEYRCAGLVTISDGLGTLLNDRLPSWPFITPILQLDSDADWPVEVRITVEANVRGTYWANVAGAAASLQLDDAAPVPVSAKRVLHVDGARTIVVRATVPVDGMQLALVREDTLEPPRPFLIAPPDQAPPGLPR
jgi:hypothetical protein